jgi:hypothetical protein
MYYALYATPSKEQGRLNIQTFFFSKFGSNLMSHNPMRSIILESVSQSHRIVTYQVRIKF